MHITSIKTQQFTNIMFAKFSVIGPGKSCDHKLFADFMNDSSAERRSCTTFRNLKQHWYTIINKSVLMHACTDQFKYAIVRIRYRKRVPLAPSCFSLCIVGFFLLRVTLHWPLTVYLLVTLDQSLWFVDKQWGGVSDDVEGGQGVVVLCQDHQLVQPFPQEISISVSTENIVFDNRIK